MRILLGLLFLIFTVAPSAVLADVDYYTYNGFDETVSAFERLSLIVNSKAYQVLAGVIAIIGVIITSLVTGVSGIVGGATASKNPLAPLFYILLGLVLFQFTVRVSETVHVYDPVRNAYKAVPNVPIGVAYIATILNKIERSIIDIISESSATPYTQNSGTLNFDIINSLMTYNEGDVYLNESISNFIPACVTPSLHYGTSGTNSTLYSGSTDLLNSINVTSVNNPIFLVRYHANNDDGGVIISCKEAFTNIKTKLGSLTTFDKMIETTCASVGYNTNDIAQVQNCKTMIEDTTKLYDVPGTSAIVFLRSIYLGKKLHEILAGRNLSHSTVTASLVNRRMIAEGIGSAEALNKWIPRLRAFIFSMVIAITPVVLIFMVTPLFSKAIMLILGFFIWLTLWGVIDAAAMQMSYDSAVDAFKYIADKKLGIDAIMLSPEGATEAIALFGKARSAALMIATVVAAALFKFGGYALAHQGGQWQQQIESTGEIAGRTAYLPEERAQFQDSVMRAPGAALRGAQGFGTAGAASGGADAARGISAADSYISSSLTGGGSGYGREAADYWNKEGSFKAAESRGHIDGMNSAGSDLGITPEQAAYSSSQVSTNISAQTNAKLAGDEETIADSNAAKTRIGANAMQGILKEFGGDEDKLTQGQIGKDLTGIHAGLGLRGNEASVGDTQAQRQKVEADTFDQVVQKVGGAQNMADGIAANQSVGVLTGGRIKEGVDLIAETEAARRVGNAGVLHETATLLDLPLDETVKQQGLANLSIPINEHNRERLAPYMTPEQQESMARLGNGSRVDFTYDQQNNQVGAIVSFGGVSATKANTSTLHTGQFVNASPETLTAGGSAPQVLSDIVGGDFNDSLSKNEIVQVADAYTKRLGLEGYTAGSGTIKSDTTGHNITYGFGINVFGTNVGTQSTDDMSVSQSDTVNRSFVGNIQEFVTDNYDIAQLAGGDSNQIAYRWAAFNDISMKDMKDAIDEGIEKPDTAMSSRGSEMKSKFAYDSSDPKGPGRY